MKKIILLFMFCFALLVVTNAQIPPNAFNYSAVARNAAGQPISITTIGIQISILKNSPIGSMLYSENHFVNTDAFGLFNLVIGGGAVQSGNISTIDWSSDNFYLKVGMDVNGGTNFLTMGTTQLLSVPYALHAKTADSIVGGGSVVGGFSHFIGEEYGGGVIFNLWKDSQGIEHGLIVDKVNLSTSQPWSNITTALVGTSQWDGLSNSNAIVGQAGQTSSAASLCLNSTNGGQSDWYLPSAHEFYMIWNNYYNVAKALSQISGATELYPGSYWSSTEDDAEYAWTFNFNVNNDRIYTGQKTGWLMVRAIRAF